MKIYSSGYSGVLLTIILILGWFALGAQLYLIILHRQASIPETITRYFSFFTVLTNLLVAIVSTIFVFKPKSKLGAYFSSSSRLTAITLYIIIVGLIYNVILRFLWAPEGLQKLADELLHTIIPSFFLFFWLFVVPRAEIKITVVLEWLLYPLLYLIYILVRGALSGFYPYPFIDVKALGYNKVVVNSIGILGVFTALALILLIINKWVKRTSVNI
jgi:hypothetical protein